MRTTPLILGLGAAALLATGCSSTPVAAPPKTISVATTTPSIPLGPASTTTPTTSGPVTNAPSGPVVKLADWTGVEPDVIGFSGDGGNIVTHIAWSSWNANSALGHGTWGYDDCDPSCAAGHVTPYPTTITLSRPSGGQFTLLTESQSGPHGQVLTFTLPSKFINGPS